MWKRLPRWMWIGSWLLAFLAGMVNYIGFSSAYRIALTHMTGLTTRLAEDIADGKPSGLPLAISIMASFVGGAVLSGVLIRDVAIVRGRQYGIDLFLEAVLLALAATTLGNYPLAGFCLAAFACGLQNAMASNFSGSTIRTTHLSGMFTDLGISLGHWLRRRPVNLLRMKICVSTISGFLMGGIGSCLLAARMGTATLYVPAGLALTLAALYQLFLNRPAAGEAA